MTPTRRRVVGASGKGAMLNSTRAVAPARAAWSRWTAQCLGGPTTSLRMGVEQHITVKLEQDKTRVGRDMNSWRSY